MQSKKLRMRPYIWLFAVAICLTIVTNVFSAGSSGEKTYLFRIVQISDSQPVPGQEEEFQRVTKVIERVNSLNPDLVLFPGDITFSGSEDEYIQLKAMLAKIKAPTHFVPGNHDTICPADETEKVLSKTELRNKKIKLYHKYFGLDYWAIEHGDFLFVGFDSTENNFNLSPERIQWLKETLLRNDKPYKFIVTHYTYAMLKDSLKELMINTKVTGYMHGHNHTTQAYQSADTGQLVFSSGSSVYSPDYGVMYFDVYKDYILSFWMPAEGSARPLGIFDLKKITSTVSSNKKGRE